MRDIRCITFDLDDTLWDCMPVILSAEQRFYEWLQQHYPNIVGQFSAEQLVHHRKQYFGQYPELKHDLTRLRKQWLYELAKDFDADHEHLVDTGFNVFWQARNNVELYQGVSDVLEHLAQNYCIGAITNGNADVHTIGIGHCFDFVVTAAEIGKAKPDASIFEQAIVRSQVRPEQILHVGDDPARDIVGAKKAGMQTAWVNPTLAAWPGGQTPDILLTSVVALPNFL